VIIDSTPSKQDTRPVPKSTNGPTDEVAIVHDYLAQTGGAERVVLTLHRAFPDAPIYTSVYEPDSTFREFQGLDIRPSILNKSHFLRHNYRLAFPFLPHTFSNMHIPAKVVICSSSGWAHGIQTDGTKLVYCHSPARWLYKPNDYFRISSSSRLLQRGLPSYEQLHSSRLSHGLVKILGSRLRNWDVAAAATAERYFVNSTITATEVEERYKRTSTLLSPPPACTVDGPSVAPTGLHKRDFYLIVSRLMPYKNVGNVTAAFENLPDKNLVVVGGGPQSEHLRGNAPPNVQFTGRISDAELRWYYQHCTALIAPAHEDYGLTPLEAATFGKPTLGLRDGGYLDTVCEGRTGYFFSDLDSDSICDAIARLDDRPLDCKVIARHAVKFSDATFIKSIRNEVAKYL
jgi:glycosyltransferase involved in cell wall biosynthesis